MMRAYELMVIIDGDVDDPKAQSYVKVVTDAITAAGGTVHGKPDWWGKRQYAYPINRKETTWWSRPSPQQGRCVSSSVPSASRTRSSATS